jgi:hypothetical protein
MVLFVGRWYAMVGKPVQTRIVDVPLPDMYRLVRQHLLDAQHKFEPYIMEDEPVEPDGRLVTFLFEITPVADGVANFHIYIGQPGWEGRIIDDLVLYRRSAERTEVEWRDAAFDFIPPLDELVRLHEVSGQQLPARTAEFPDRVVQNRMAQRRERVKQLAKEHTVEEISETLQLEGFASFSVATVNRDLRALGLTAQRSRPKK